MENNEKRTKVSNKEISEQIAKIGEIRNNLYEVISSMPKCAARDAFEYCVTNIDKKVERFSVVKEKVTPEEKEVMQQALKAFREQKGENAPIEIKEDEVSTPSEVEEVKTEKKSKRK